MPIRADVDLKLYRQGVLTACRKCCTPAVGRVLRGIKVVQLKASRTLKITDATDRYRVWPILIETPRYEQCRVCEQSAVGNAVEGTNSRRVLPELEHLQRNWHRSSYRKAATVAQRNPSDLGRLNAATIRNRALAVGERIEAELSEENRDRRSCGSSGTSDGRNRRRLCKTQAEKDGARNLRFLPAASSEREAEAERSPSYAIWTNARNKKYSRVATQWPHV